MTVMRWSGLAGLLSLCSLLFAACGPSAEQLCTQLNEVTCSDGSMPYELETHSICVEDLHATNCSGQYRDLVDCEINTPECDGEFGCGDLRDKWLGCAYNNP